MNIGKIRQIPLNEQTAYLAGVIIGDGSLRNSFKSPNGRDYGISIQITDYALLSKIETIVKSLITTKTELKQRLIPGKQPLWRFDFRNKSLYYFLNETLRIPRGKKSAIVSVPEKILNSTGALKKAFLAGTFDTDGGCRGRAPGLSTASKLFRDQLVLLYRQFGFQIFKDQWVNKRNGRAYYGLRLSVREVDRFLREFPLQDEGKRKTLFERYTCGRARAENGPESNIAWPSLGGSA